MVIRVRIDLQIPIRCEVRIMETIKVGIKHAQTINFFAPDVAYADVKKMPAFTVRKAWCPRCSGCGGTG